MIEHVTVPAPSGWGYTCTPPTPSMARMNCRYESTLPPNGVPCILSIYRALSASSVSMSVPLYLMSVTFAEVSPAMKSSESKSPEYESPIVPSSEQVRSETYCVTGSPVSSLAVSCTGFDVTRYTSKGDTFLAANSLPTGGAILNTPFRTDAVAGLRVSPRSATL